jgi:hypothetical protein
LAIKPGVTVPAKCLGAWPLHRDHVLAGLGEGRALPLLAVDCHDPLHLEHRLALVSFGQLGLNSRSLIDEFAPSSRGPVLGVGL